VPRPIHDPAAASAAAAAFVQSFQSDVVLEVARAVREERVVVVGMKQNPHVKNVRRALDDAGVAYRYLEFGSYLSGWKPRLAIKMWSGWPTFPQVFVRCELFGGEDLVKAALADGSLKARLDRT
jgi:glutaredoxin-related protein